MTRKFKPNSFGLKKDFFADALEARLKHSGEYVYHIPTGKDKQAIVANYQYIPQDSGGDFPLITTNPTLFCLRQHFDEHPEIYTKARGAHAEKGSQFEIRGMMYNVKKVDVNHRGYMTIELVHDDLCATPRTYFDEEMEVFLCSLELNCDDT